MSESHRNRPSGKVELKDVVVALAFGALALVEYVKARSACGGEYVYPIDDTYIHMVMAKTLAVNGVWGVEPGKLAFCSSSPLWTLILGGLYFVFGVADVLPWLLALGFNIASLFLVSRALGRLGASVCWQLGGAAAVAVAGPFLCTTALGMEHALHAFCLIGAVVAASGIVGGSNRRLHVATLLAAAATASRYESLFVLGPLAAGLIGLETHEQWRRRERILPWRGVVFGLAAVLPVFVYGLWAVSQGGHFLPNSLLLKGSFRTFWGIVREIEHLLASVRPGCGFLYLLFLTLAAAGSLRRTPLFWRIAAGSVMVAIVAQLVFADVGQLCRYEAYLTSLGAFVAIAAVVSAGGFGRAPLAYLPIGVFAWTAFVFWMRAERAFGEAVHSSSDICNQQVLMTRIMSGLPEEDRGCVALNDLGYMAMYGGFPIVDFWGLGSQDATELMLKHPGHWIREDYDKLISDHDVKYLVVFEKWYPNRLMPYDTVDVAKLILKDNFACGADTVVFRATSEEYAERLHRHLSKYVDKMPPRATLKLVR